MDRRLLAGLFAIGRLFSPLYGLAMRLRAALYRFGLLPSARLALPVISVGNLSMGGTGKTPMVLYLARLLQAAGYRPAVLSRGYGGANRQPVNLVADGRTVFLAPAEAGDEPVLIAQSLPGVAVVTARRRALGGRLLVERNLADVVLLDDGFQHLALGRDLDLVLFAAQSTVLDDWVFPGGLLREPWSAVQRAHVFVITGATEQARSRVEALSARLAALCPTTPVFRARYLPVAVYRQDGPRQALESLADEPLYAFCGLANPSSFFASLEGHCRLLGRQAFNDHHPFSPADLEALARQARSLGCRGLITTEKDFVKISRLAPPPTLPLWVLAVELCLEQGFDRLVLERLAGARG